MKEVPLLDGFQLYNRAVIVTQPKTSKYLKNSATRNHMQVSTSVLKGKVLDKTDSYVFFFFPL